MEVNNTESEGGVFDGQERGEAKVEEKDRDEEALHHIMTDLEAATGFDSYKAYLESFRRDPLYAGRSYTDILDGCFRGRRDAGAGVDLIDVSDEGLCLRGVHLSAPEISVALRQSTPGTSARIVL